MSRAKLNGVELEYDIRGSGEPVVLVHAGVFANWFTPLRQEPALSGGGMAEGLAAFLARHPLKGR